MRPEVARCSKGQVNAVLKVVVGNGEETLELNGAWDEGAGSLGLF